MAATAAIALRLALRALVAGTLLHGATVLATSRVSRKSATGMGVTAAIALTIVLQARVMLHHGATALAPVVASQRNATGITAIARLVLILAP